MPLCGPVGLDLLLRYEARKTAKRNIWTTALHDQLFSGSLDPLPKLQVSWGYLTPSHAPN